MCDWCGHGKANKYTQRTEIASTINKLLKYCEKEIVCVVPTLNVADAIRTVSKNLITDVVSKKGKNKRKDE